MKKKTSSRKTPVTRRGRVLPNGACPNCGTQMVIKRGTLRLPINGEEVAVASAAHLRCPRCGEILLRFQDAKRLGEDAIAIYRQEARATLGRRDPRYPRAVRSQPSGPGTSAPPRREHGLALGIGQERVGDCDGHSAPIDSRPARKHIDYLRDHAA